MPPHTDDGSDDQPIARMMAGYEPAVRGDLDAGDAGVAAGSLGDDTISQKNEGAQQKKHTKGTKRKVGASGFRGVAFHLVSGKFRARITSSTGDGRQRALGYFPTKEEAAKAWDRAARGLGFDEEYLNFPFSGAEGSEGGPGVPIGVGGADAAGAGGGTGGGQRATHGRQPTHARPNPAVAASLRVSPTHADTDRDNEGLTDESLVVNGGFQHVVGASVGRRGQGGFAQDDFAQKDPAVDLADGVETASGAPASSGALPPGKQKRPGNGTGVKGVRAKGNGQYEARIKLRGDPNRRCLGRFKTVLAAMRAYDDAARQAGYCVNECGKVGDLLDSDTYGKIGVPTPRIAKGVKSVTKSVALELTSRENGPSVDANDLGVGVGASAGMGKHVASSFKQEPPPNGAPQMGTLSSGTRPDGGGATADGTASGALGGMGTRPDGVEVRGGGVGGSIPGGPLSSGPSGQTERVTDLPVPGSAEGPFTRDEIASLQPTVTLYAGFILDKPGIHRFLGVFLSPDQALRAVKTSVPEWKRRNELKGGGKKNASVSASVRPNPAAPAPYGQTVADGNSFGKNAPGTMGPDPLTEEETRQSEHVLNGNSYGQTVENSRNNQNRSGTVSSAAADSRRVASLADDVANA